MLLILISIAQCQIPWEVKVPKYTSSEDLVHLNLAGYKVMENIVLEVLNKN